MSMLFIILHSRVHFTTSGTPSEYFQYGADERLIYATTLLAYCALSLRAKKRSSSTLALNKSGEGCKKSMFRTSSDGLLETPLHQHHRSLSMQFIISCVACFLEWDLNPQNDILNRAQAQAARVDSRTRRYNPQGLPFPYPKRLRFVVLKNGAT